MEYLKTHKPMLHNRITLAWIYQKKNVENSSFFILLKNLRVLNLVLIHTKNPPVFEFCIRVKPRFMSSFISVTFGILTKAEIKKN